MKKNILSIVGSLLLATFLNSCSTERELELNSSYEGKSLSARMSNSCEFFENGVESRIIPNVKAINFDNAISTSCRNNILVFSSKSAYEKAIELLDNNIESHNNGFDQQTVGMTDVQADDYADNIGFNEDQPLLDFEEDLNFCSLRSYIEKEDNYWLSQQGDGAWNLNTCPDSHYIDDETERTLLSIGSEYIIGNCKEGYKYYKEFDWGTLEVDITDIDLLSQVIKTINEMVNPSNINGISYPQLTNYLNTVEIGHKIDIKDIGAVVQQIPTFPNDCKNQAKEKGEKIFSSERRIRWKHKVNRLTAASGNVGIKGKSITKSFRKKNGKWKKYRASISAGLNGVAYLNCSTADSMTSSTEKRRKRLKHIKWIDDLGGSQQNKKLKPNGLFSVHKQEGYYFQDEIY